MAFLDSDPTEWELTTISEEEVEPGTPSSDPTEWVLTKIDPEGAWVESEPTAWVMTTITPEGGLADSDPSAWVMTTIAARPPSTGIYIVNDNDELVEAWLFTADEFD